MVTHLPLFVYYSWAELTHTPIPLCTTLYLDVVSPPSFCVLLLYQPGPTAVWAGDRQKT